MVVDGEGKAECHGAASLVNGIVTGTGSSFGIGLKTTASVKLIEAPGRFDVKINNDSTGSPYLAIASVRNVLHHFGLEKDYGARITTDSDIPISRGLKSSSTAANAITLATLDSLSEHLDDRMIISMGVKAALDSSVTITGAFDDACASYFGNVVVTDNLEMRMLKHFKIEDEMEVLIHVPERKILKEDVDRSKINGIIRDIEEAVEYAMVGDYISAMRINGMSYGKAMGLDTSVAEKAIELGAITAGISGTGPAIVILCKPGTSDEFKEKIDGSSWLETTLNSERARIID